MVDLDDAAAGVGAREDAAGDIGAREDAAADIGAHEDAAADIEAHEDAAVGVRACNDALDSSAEGQAASYLAETRSLYQLTGEGKHREEEVCDRLFKMESSRERLRLNCSLRFSTNHLPVVLWSPADGSGKA